MDRQGHLAGRAPRAPVDLHRRRRLGRLTRGERRGAAVPADGRQRVGSRPGLGEVSTELLGDVVDMVARRCLEGGRRGTVQQRSMRGAQVVVHRRPHQCVRELEVHRRIVDFAQHPARRPLAPHRRHRAATTPRRHAAGPTTRCDRTPMPPGSAFASPARAGRPVPSPRRTPHPGSSTVPTPHSRCRRTSAAPRRRRTRCPRSAREDLPPCRRRGMSGRREQHPDLVDPEAASATRSTLPSRRDAEISWVRSTSPSGSVSR